jgi:hypothetical protein
MVFTPEILTLLGSSGAGFLFKYMAERARERQQIVELALKKQEAADNSADKAAQRVPIDAGKWTRRMIVVACVFGVILAPFILTLLNLNTVVTVESIKPTWLFGLFGGGVETKFVELSGFFMAPEVRQTLLAIMGFYFGSAAAKH